MLTVKPKIKNVWLVIDAGGDGSVIIRQYSEQANKLTQKVVVSKLITIPRATVQEISLQVYRYRHLKKQKLDSNDDNVGDCARADLSSVGKKVFRNRKAYIN